MKTDTSRFKISRLAQTIVAVGIFAPACTAVSAQDASSLMVAKAATVTVLNAAPNPAKLDEPVRLTAKVDAANSLELVPTGTVSFYDDATLLGTSDLTQGKATLQNVIFTTKGKHKLIARYSGDANFDASSTKRLGIGDVTLLLHMEGTTGSKVFKDSSNHDTENIPVDDGLVAQITGAQSHAGKSSGWFDSLHQVSYPASANWDMGAGDFTVETWARFEPNGIGTRTRMILTSQCGDQGQDATFNIGKDTADRITATVLTDAPSKIELTDPTQTVVADAWYHLALVRDGSMLTLYVNGKPVHEQPIAGAIPTRTTKFSVGMAGEYYYVVPGKQDWWTHMWGWLDDFRLTKAAVYKADFTPPTSLPDPVMRVK